MCMGMGMGMSMGFGMGMDMGVDPAEFLSKVASPPACAVLREIRMSAPLPVRPHVCLQSCMHPW